MKGITNYARREYGVTAKQLEAFDKAVERRYQESLRNGTLLEFTPEELRRCINQLVRQKARRKK